MLRRSARHISESGRCEGDFHRADSRRQSDVAALSLRLFADCLYVNDYADFVTHHDPAFIERGIPTDPEVVTVDSRRGSKASPNYRTFIDTIFPVWRLPLAKILQIQNYPPGDPANGEEPSNVLPLSRGREDGRGRGQFAARARLLAAAAS